MVPPWPEARFEQEWRSLLQRDLSEKGPIDGPAAGLIEIRAPVTVENAAPPAVGNELVAWSVHRWASGEKPKRRFLVNGLVMAGKQHLIVAEGGAGKTFLAMDLCLKVAAPRYGDEWAGLPINVEECGGTVVLITTEDDQDELHIRMNDIDPEGRRFEAGDRLIIVPTINAGGSFPLVERDRAGNATVSRAWAAFLERLRALPDLKLVVIDTLNSTLHGEENNATVINEYVRAANQVCGALGAALMITHHIRKQGDEPIRTAEDMKNAVRGSSALPAAFRAVLGIWHASDYERRMTAMGLKPRKGQLYKLAVVKANNPEMFSGERTLLRVASGMLTDATQKDRYQADNDDRMWWLLKAIELAAMAGHPYTKSGKSGVYDRRGELPKVLHDTGKNELASMVAALEKMKLVAPCKYRNSGQACWLDVTGGPFAMGNAIMATGAYAPLPDWSLWGFDFATQRVVRVK